MRLLGHDVSGSDVRNSELIETLRSAGIQILLEQKAENIPEGTDLFVYSEAIPEDSAERQEAKERSIRFLSYFQALGELTKGKRLIAVCGTHGKSSTTAMTIAMLERAGLDPNAIVGTKLPMLGGRNWRKGKSDLWIVEACEYRRSFLALNPTIVLLTNADGDHFDSFKNAEDYRNAFTEFIRKLPESGTLIAHGNDPESQSIAEQSRAVFMNADTETLPDLSVPGLHMRKNAQLVAALGSLLGIEQSQALAALKQYKGSWRRMEEKGTRDGITVIDDYAHHPVEIRATISAMREAHPSRRIVAVFEPHTHDRTKKMFDAFAASFREADIVVVTSVYDARPDQDTERVEEANLAEAISKQSNVPCVFGGSIGETENIVRTNIAKSGDVVLCMGAGDITKLASALMGS